MKRLHLGIGLIVIVALGAFIGLNEPNKVAQEKRPTTKHEKIKKVDVNQTIAPSGTLGAQIAQRAKDSHHSGTLLVAQNGKIILNQGFGLANKSAIRQQPLNLCMVSHQFRRI